MRVALDTNRYVAFCRGGPAAVQFVQQAHEIFLPFLVIAELRAGFLCGTRAHQNKRPLTKFLNSDRVGVPHPDERITHHHARLFHRLREPGTPIPTKDIWIAALAARHALTLFARDRHFEHLPQLARI